MGLQNPEQKPYNKQLIDFECSVSTGKSQTLTLPFLPNNSNSKVLVWDFAVKTSLLVNKYIVHLVIFS